MLQITPQSKWLPSVNLLAKFEHRFVTIRCIVWFPGNKMNALLMIRQ